MRAAKITILALLAAASLATAPANAGPHFMPHPHMGGFMPQPHMGGGHWGGYGYWGHGYWGGPGLAFGLAAGAVIAAGVAADACVRYVPVRDSFGNVVGSRPVNVC